jgi:transmembrane sensor
VWLARLKRGLRRAEGPELLAWLKRRSHRMAIAKAAAEWHGPEVLAVLSQIFPIPPAIGEPRRGARPALLIAAAFAGACVALGVPVAILISAGAHRYVYATARDARKRLTLEDGTRVELTRATQIIVTYAEHIRSVSLARGEAVFKVANRPHSPFYVHAGGVNFETHAATFDVRFAQPGRMSLTVLKGTVIALPHPVAKPAAGADPRVFKTKLTRPILLEPLQMLVIEHGEESGQALTEQDVRSRLAWQSGT